MTMQYFGHSITLPIDQAARLLDDSRQGTTAEGIAFRIEPHDAYRTAILVEQQEHSYQAYLHLKALMREQEPFDDLWDRLKASVTAARTTRTRMTTKDDSWVTTSATSLEVVRPNALIKVQLSDENVLELAGNLISHLITDRHP